MYLCMQPDRVRYGVNGGGQWLQGASRSAVGGQAQARQRAESMCESESAQVVSDNRFLLRMKVACSHPVSGANFRSMVCRRVCLGVLRRGTDPGYQGTYLPVQR